MTVLFNYIIIEMYETNQTKMEQIKKALDMLNTNQPMNTPMPNTNLTLGEYLLTLGIKQEEYYENLLKTKKLRTFFSNPSLITNLFSSRKLS